MRVAIVDDDSIVTTSLATILSAQEDIEVVGVGHDGVEAAAIFARQQPDILLMDIQMPAMSGLDAARNILASAPAARIVFLTTFANDEYIVQALRMGVKGYLIKQEVATIAPALRSVMAGQSVLGGEVLERLDVLTGSAGPTDKASNSNGQQNSKLALLSEREREIVELIAEGLDNREIAAKVYISDGTVRNHISTILSKLNLKNRTQLAILYYQS